MIFKSVATKKVYEDYVKNEPEKMSVIKSYLSSLDKTHKLEITNKIQNSNPENLKVFLDSLSDVQVKKIESINNFYFLEEPTIKKRKKKGFKTYLSLDKQFNRRLKTFFRSYGIGNRILINKEFRANILNSNCLEVLIGGDGLSKLTKGSFNQKNAEYEYSKYAIKNAGFKIPNLKGEVLAKLFYIQPVTKKVGKVDLSNYYLQVKNNSVKLSEKQEIEIDLQEETVACLATKMMPIKELSTISPELNELLDKQDKISLFPARVKGSKSPLNYEVLLYSKKRIVPEHNKKTILFPIGSSTIAFDISPLGKFFFIEGLVILKNRQAILLYEKYEMEN